jgi:Bax protein
LTRSFQKSPAAGLAFVLLLALSACGAVDSTSTEVAEEGVEAVSAVEETAVDTSNMTSVERAEATLRTVPGQVFERFAAFDQRMNQLPEQMSDHFAFDEDKAVKVKDGGFEFQDGTINYIFSEWLPRISGSEAREARAEAAREARAEEERQQQIAQSPQGIDFSQATPLTATATNPGNQLAIAPSYGAGAGQVQLAANPSNAMFNRPAVNKSLPGGIEGVGRFFDQNGYRLESIRRGALVPPVFARTLPRDMNNSVPANKDVFIRLLLPLVLKANAEVAMERAIILNSGYSGTIPQAPVEVQAIAAKYDIQSNTSNLLQRVDILPPSLILAQAGLESGWGTSRYVQQGNALFGQRVWDASQPGMTPNARDADATHRVRTFTSLEESIRSYLRNLNMNNAYLELRRTRASYRAAGRPVTALELIPRLQYYSEDPAYYLGTLNRIVSDSRLTDVDRAALSNGQPMNLFL